MTVFDQRRQALLVNVDCDAYMVVDLARLMPKEIDHTSLYYLSGYQGDRYLHSGLWRRAHRGRRADHT